MNSNDYSMEEPIVALATPWGESAIAVIRTSGNGVVSLVDKLFRGKKKLVDTPPNSVVYGVIMGPKGAIDEVLISIFRAPASYTGEDSVEISCHGGLPIIRRILELLLDNGFRLANPGEFTLRAFLNGKMDLTRAEAVNELIKAKTDTARELAFHRLQGSIKGRIEAIKRELVDVLSSVELRLDYPDDEIEEEDEFYADFDRLGKIKDSIGELLATYRTGKIYQEGISVAIAGRTNAGKSTLFNLLLREERAIVSEIHGTTRDYIEGNISIDGIPVRLFDTAGLRESSDPVEVEGIKRTGRVIENADVILYIVDGSLGVTEEDRERIKEYDSYGKLIKVWNKADIANGESPLDFVSLSAVTGKGLFSLIEKIKSAVFGEEEFKNVELSVKSGMAVIDSLRQRELLENCLNSLEQFEEGLRSNISLDVTAIYIQEAVASLGEITGEVSSADVLNNIFSNFCVGK